MRQSLNLRHRRSPLPGALTHEHLTRRLEDRSGPAATRACLARPALTVRLTPSSAARAERELTHATATMTAITGPPNAARTGPMPPGALIDSPDQQLPCSAQNGQ